MRRGRASEPGPGTLAKDAPRAFEMKLKRPDL